MVCGIQFGFVRFNLNESFSYIDIKVFAVSGRCGYQDHFMCGDGPITYQLPTANLAPGLYIVEVVGENKKRYIGKLVVIPGDFDWDDIGDFAAIGKLHAHGRTSDLAILGENARVLADSSSGVVIAQGGRMISLIGVTDIVVVDTPDALLVTTTANAQRVKAVVDALKLSGRTDVL